jgi:hypothetical protein
LLDLPATYARVVLMTNPNDIQATENTTDADKISQEYDQLIASMEAGDTSFFDPYYQEYIYGPGEEDEDLVETGEDEHGKSLKDSPALLEFFFQQAEDRLDSWWTKDRELFDKAQTLVSCVLGFYLPMVPNLEAAFQEGFSENLPWTESPKAPFHWRSVIALVVEALDPGPYSVTAFSSDLLADYPDILKRMQTVEEQEQEERDMHMTE